MKTEEKQRAEEEENPFQQAREEEEGANALEMQKQGRKELILLDDYY